MKKLLAISMFFVIIFSSISFAGEIKPDLSEILSNVPSGDKVSIIIHFKQRPTGNDIDSLRGSGANIKHQYDIIDAVAVSVPSHVVDKISKRASVELVEPDYQVKLVLDESVKQIQSDRVWQNSTGSGVNVAIIDTGIDNDNPLLNVLQEVDFTGEGTDDLNGHGTHVAGIVASVDSNIKGVSYGANLFDVKVLNQFGSGYGSDVIQGIEWAVDNNIDIISMSLGASVDPCDGTDAISKAVDKAVQSGVTVIVAAGNFGPDSFTITSPGCSKNGITVGAVDGNDDITSWSSRGPTDDGRVKPDVVAPGVSISSTWIDGNFKSLSGTSMATPHVSGTAALLLQVNESLTPDQIKKILTNTSVDLGLDENIQGSGRIDSYLAYLSIANTTSDNTTDNITNDTENNTQMPPGLEKSKDKMILPGSFLYKAKRALERVELFLTFDRADKARKYVELAQERLTEAQVMANRGQTDYVDRLVEEYDKNLDRGKRISDIAKQVGENVSKVEDLIESAQTIHIEVLQEVVEKVPPQAKKQIENIISGDENNDSYQNDTEDIFNVDDNSRNDKDSQENDTLTENNDSPGNVPQESQLERPQSDSQNQKEDGIKSDESSNNKPENKGSENTDDKNSDNKSNNKFGKGNSGENGKQNSGMGRGLGRLVEIVNNLWFL